ncbi:MAG: hypothetical protein IT580_12655 [Verrucomicrobiales bacterium]|nr:hypothetical protein [Verrucomicrobiales bacterium]
MRREAGRFWPSAVWLAGWMCLWLGVGASAVRAEVGLELAVPPRATHVLGDGTPLIWRFSNRGAEPLGFMWEGCCRLNGRLTVTRNGVPVEGVPPSQALAHMFAKAERLDPGLPRDYETRVSDWVLLPGSGTYELQGRYRGVLSNQFPQLPRGLGLWRDAAVSEPVRLSVLSVADYARRRDDHGRRRGVVLEVTGATRLPPLQPAEFRLRVANQTTQAIALRWPDDFSLWILDAQDHRVAPVAVLSEPSVEWVIPARGADERGFRIAPERVEGEPLGDYRVFVDLAEAGADQPRVPSNIVPLEWRWPPSEVWALVDAAARGAGTGARNQPLKLLRVYCEALAQPLSQAVTNAATAEGRTLAVRLARAARLKPLARVPGPVTFSVRLAADATYAWSDPRLVEAFDARQTWAEQWEDLIAVRRHLGWEPRLEIRPDSTVRFAVMRATLSTLGVGARELGAPVQTRLGSDTNGIPPVLVWGEDLAADTHPTLTLRSGSWTWAVPGALPETGSELEALRVRVRAAVAAAAAGRGGIRLEVDPELTWGHVAGVVEPLSVPGMRWGVAATRPGS